MQPFCPTSEYHHAAGLSGQPTGATAAITAVGHHHHQSSGNSPSGFPNKSAVTNDIDAYTSYNNWPNSYNNYQYGSCAPPPPPQPHHQYGAHAAPPPATMVLYPHVYSTVNQNQIHLHLHGTDKLEQYLGSTENALTISSARGGIEIGIGTADQQSAGDVIMGGPDGGGTVVAHQSHDDDIDEANRTVDDDQAIVGDPGSVWRPY